MMNIAPNKWGKYYWYVFYTTVITYPDNPTNEDKHNTKNFLLLFGSLLPCEKCRINFKKHLEKYPLNDNILGSKNNLINWAVTINNEVNKTLCKKEVTTKQILEKYLALYKGNKTNHLFVSCVILLCLMVLIFLIIKKFK